ETAYRIELGRWSLVDHQDFAGHAGLTRGECHSLGSVARADGPNAAPPLFFRQKPNSVICSPNFEGTDGLQALQLQVNVGWAVVVEPHQRSAYGSFIDVPARVVDKRRRNVALRRVAAGCKIRCHSGISIRPKI